MGLEVFENYVCDGQMEIPVLYIFDEGELMENNGCYENDSAIDKALDLIIAHCGDKIWEGSHEQSGSY